MRQISLKKNFIMNAILAVSTIVFPLITFPYSSRILGPEGIGQVQFAVSLIAYFTMFAQLGIPTYGIRACASVRDDKLELTRRAQELLTINVVMSLVSYGLLALGVAFIPRLQEEKTLIFVVSATIILSAIGMEWLYKALEQYTYIAIRSIIFKVIAIIAMFLLIKSEDDYILYGGISIFAASASNILNFINIRKYIGLKPVGGYDFKRHLKAVMVFFAMACATTIYTNLDTVMLGFMKGNTDTGYYTAAVKVKTVLVACITSLGEVLLPRVSYYITHDLKEDFTRISKKAMNFVLVVAIPLMVYFIFFAKEAILLLSGNEYMGAVVPMQVIMPTVVFIGITNLLGIEIMVPIGKEKMVLLSVAIGAVADLILNFIFIPIIGAAGASLGTLVAEMLVFIVQMAALKDVAVATFADIKYVKILLGVLVGAVVSFWVKLLNFPVIIALLMSAMLFFGGYLAILVLTKEKLVTELLKSGFRRLKKQG